MGTPQVEERKINIVVKEHRKTHLLLATSVDLPGLMIAARSEEQLDREIPAAIREVLEAQGKIVLSVTAESPQGVSSGFIHRTIAAHAKLTVAL